MTTDRTASQANRSASPESEAFSDPGEPRRQFGIMEPGRAAEAFGALAQETRLELLRLLIARGPTGVMPGEISSALSVPPSTLSFHLSALDRVGLIHSSKHGRNLIYSVSIIRLRSLFGFFGETCWRGCPGECGESASLLPEMGEQRGMIPAFNVLFLCTHNSARSIMAEGVLNSIGQGRFRPYSAGSDPVAVPRTDVVEKLRAMGHDITGLQSKAWNEFIGPTAPRMDFVFALCDTVIGQAWPDFGNQAIRADWPLPDPAKFSGNAVERATLMNELYVSLHRRLAAFISLPFASLNRASIRARLGEIGVGLRL